MTNQLDQLLTRMKDKYGNNILSEARNYMEVDIGKEADEMGYDDLKEKLHDVYAVIPLREAVSGMKVRIDGRTFVNYIQFDSGIAVPAHIARRTRLPHKRYEAWDSMVCNFA